MTAILQLPVIDRPLDNTAMALYMSCPRKFLYSMVRHRRQGGAPSPAIAYGSAWHHMLEAHYKSNGNIDEVFKALVTKWEQHDRPDDHRTRDRAWMEYQKYVERWGLPENEDAQTVGFPDSPAVEIPANVEFPGVSHPYAGKIDRIIELNGQYYVEDHKTTSRMGSYYFKQFELSHQMQGYICLAQMFIPSVKIAGVRINAHAIYKRESAFERQIISFAPARLDDFKATLELWIQRIRESYETGVFPGNYNACDGKYGMCQYAGVCSVSPSLRDKVLEQEFDYNPWNPLEAADDEVAPE
jgi:hypothetical protein